MSTALSVPHSTAFSVIFTQFCWLFSLPSVCFLYICFFKVWAPKLDRMLQQNPFHIPLLMQQILFFLQSCELLLPNFKLLLSNAELDSVV